MGGMSMLGSRVDSWIRTCSVDGVVVGGVSASAIFDYSSSHGSLCKVSPHLQLTMHEDTKKVVGLSDADSPDIPRSNPRGQYHVISWLLSPPRPHSSVVNPPDSLKTRDPDKSSVGKDIPRRRDP